MIPTLSQIRGWDIEHLTVAAQQWTSRATAWNDAVTEVDLDARRPGGAVWEGRAAESAQTRTAADRVRVLGLADTLNALAYMARSGASDVQTAQQRALSAVAAANAAGFEVGEDLSVVHRVPGRQVQAQVIAANLRTAAASLSALDSDLADRIIAASAALDNVAFPESPFVDPNPADLFNAPTDSTWSINCVPNPAGGWDCTFLIGNGWYSEHFYAPPK